MNVSPLQLKDVTLCNIVPLSLFQGRRILQKLAQKGKMKFYMKMRLGLAKRDAFSKQVYIGHHSWVTGTLGCKQGIKNGRNVAKVFLERYEQE